MIMRPLFVVPLAIFSATPALAGTYDYNAPENHQERIIPSQQYPKGSPKAVDNGRVLRENSSNYLSSPDYEINASVETGYRNSDLQWNIAGGGVNILSELTWEQVGGYQVKPSIEYTQKTGYLKGLNIQASMTRSKTTSGDNQDSDYNGNNRTLEFSRSNNSADAGDSQGFSASIGYAFNFGENRTNNRIRFITLVGYAMQNQTFTMRDGFQTIPATGPFAGLRSEYEMDLKMPFIGLDASGKLAEDHSLRVTGKISRGTYEGVGRWNLRTDFAQPDSFKQKADGFGFDLGVKYGWEFYPRTQLTLAYNYQYFKSDDGTDKTFLANGTTVTGRLNEAEYSAMDFLAGLNYKF